MGDFKIDWTRSISGWVDSLRAAGKSPATVELRTGQIDRLRRHVAPLGLGPWDVSGGDLRQYLGGATWATETRRSCRSGLRSFYGWAVKAGYVATSPAHELDAIRPTPPAPRPAPLLAYTHALAQADDRLALMLRLACDCGLRRGEVARVRVEDVEDDLAGRSLRVLGKGRRVRRVPLPDDLARELLRAASAGYVFPGADHGHLSARWVGKLVGRALPGAWTMHTLRHRFATDAYAVDRDTFSVQRLLGHSSPATTERYVLLPDDALRATVNAVAAARSAARRTGRVA